MKMKLALLTVVVASLALAQGPRGFGMHPMGGPGGHGPGAGMAAPTFDNIKTYLGLSDSQLTAIQAVRAQAQTANQQTMTDIHTKETALQTLLKTSSPDPTAVGKLVIDIATLRATLHSSNTSLTDQAVALLTADQKTKLKVLSDAAALQPQIHEAAMLLLITPPAGPAGGMGVGMGMGMGMGRH